jgi:hypothetical protein
MPLLQSDETFWNREVTDGRDPTVSLRETGGQEQSIAADDHNMDETSHDFRNVQITFQLEVSFKGTRTLTQTLTFLSRLWCMEGSFSSNIVPM